GNVVVEDARITPLASRRENTLPIERHANSLERIERTPCRVDLEEDVDVEVARTARISPEAVRDRPADRVRNARFAQGAGYQHRKLRRVERPLAHAIERARLLRDRAQDRAESRRQISA